MTMFILKQNNTLFPNIDLSNYFTKTETDDLDNGLTNSYFKHLQ